MNVALNVVLWECSLVLLEIHFINGNTRSCSVVKTIKLMIVTTKMLLRTSYKQVCSSVAKVVLEDHWMSSAVNMPCCISADAATLRASNGLQQGLTPWKCC